MPHEPVPSTLATRRQALLTLAAAGASTLLARPAHAVAVGEAAPALQLPGLTGPVDLAALQGQVVLLDFWASWCAPCKLSFPWMNALQTRLGPRGLQVVAVNLDRQRSAADLFLRQTPAQFLVAFDPSGDSPRLFGVKAMPTSLLIGADGRVLLQHDGFRDSDRPTLEAAVEAALTRRR